MNKFTKLLTIVAGGLLAIQASASPLPAEDRGVKAPKSYTDFFPSSSNKVLPESKSGGIELLEPQAKPVKAPRLNFNKRRAASDASSSIYGYLYYSRNNSLESGFYNIDVATGRNTLNWIDYYTDWGMVMTNGWLRDGKICGMNSFTFMGGILSYNYVELDLNTGEALTLIPLTLDANDYTNVYLTMAYRELDDMVYGYGYCDDGESNAFNCAPYNDIDGSRTIKKVGIEDVCIALCYNIQDDLLYGVTTGGNFVSIDFEGNQTFIFNVGLSNLRDAVTGMVFNPDDGTFTWNAYFQNNTSGMYRIDPKAKTATKISDCPYGEEYIFMVNTEGYAADVAPGIPVIESLDFSGISTSGTMTAVLPTTTHSGETLSGNLNWQLYIDGNLSAEGSAQSGSSIEAALNNVPSGMHVFALMASKDGYRSEPAIVKKWIGADSPKAPANVVLTDSQVTWSAVSEGVHGGYVDAEAVSYTVYLNDIKLGETDGTSLNAVYPEGKPYQTYNAYVIASSNGVDSEAGVSNPFNYGDALRIEPSIHYRPEEWELPLFTILNADGLKDNEGNDITWHYFEDMAFPAFSSGYDGDDWLFFPPMLFDNVENAYCYIMEAGLVHDSDTRGRISVYIGKEATPEAMTQTILPPHQCEHMRGDDIKEYFAVNEPGVYYIGVHAISHNVAFHISDMDISVTDISAEVPVSVSNLNAVADPDGKLQATVTFTMPELTSKGEAIPEDANLTATVSSFIHTTGSTERGEMVDAQTVSGKPGSQQTVVIGTAQNDNLITVAAAINGKYGAEASTLLYTGLVRPYIVQDLKAEVSEDNMSMHLTWNPPVEGEEDGAIGDTFYYTIWYYNNSWEFGDFVGWDVTEYTYTLPEGSEQQWIRLGIMALNDAGQSYHVTSVTEVIGTPYTLPIVETFPDYYEEYEPIMVQRPTPEYEHTYWYVDDPADILSKDFANESGVAYIGFVSSENPDVVIKNAKSRLSLPKFSTRNLDEISFTLEYFGGLHNKYAAKFHLLANGYGITPVNVADFPKGEGWISHSVILPETFSNRDWVELLLDADYADDQEFAMFSGYSVASGSGKGSLTADTEGRVSASHGMLHVVGFPGQPLVVSDLAGRIVIMRDRLDLQNGFMLSPGIYMVKAGNKSFKIVIP